MKYCLVAWVDHNEQTSVLEDVFVHNKDMLHDQSVIGMVTHGDTKQKEPTDGWEVAMARVLFTAGRLCLE
jgi:hypothetical protein